MAGRLVDPSITFGELQELRNRESRLLVACSILKATLDIIRSLEACARSLSSEPGSSRVLKADPYDDLVTATDIELRALKSLRLKCKGYANSAEVVRARYNTVLALVRCLAL